MGRRFLALHLISGTDEERVQRSLKEVSALQQFGVEYKLINNPLYTELPPKETCRRPEAVRADLHKLEDTGEEHWYELNPRHYGCFKAHKDSILENFKGYLDGLLVFECDAVCAVVLEEFYSRLLKLDEICKAHPDIFIVQLGFRHAGVTKEIIEDLYVINQFIGTHAYFLPGSSREKIFELLNNRPWDAMDMWYTHYCTIENLKIAIFNDRPIWNQADGPSYIQAWVSSSETTYKNTRYK